MEGQKESVDQKFLIVCVHVLSTHIHMTLKVITMEQTELAECRDTPVHQNNS